MECYGGIISKSLLEIISIIGSFYGTKTTLEETCK